MYFSRQSISRTGFMMVSLACLTIGACTQPNQSSNPSPTTNLASETASTASQTDKPQADQKVQGNAKEQFKAIVGTKKDGWLPKVLAGKGLKQGLTPAAAGKIIPGAEQVSEFGFSKVAVQDVPALKQYEFYYAKDSSGKPTQLQSVKLHFDPDVNQAYPDLVKILSSKYGAVKPEDVEKQIVTWVGPEFVTAQLTKPAMDFGGYELNVSLEKQ